MSLAFHLKLKKNTTGEKILLIHEVRKTGYERWWKW